MLRQLALLISLALLSSCGTLFAEKIRKVVVTSSPPGAAIEVNGTPYGVTPQRITVQNNERLVLTIQKEGFHSAGCLINSKIRPRWIILDALIFFLVLPLVVDFVTNRWSELETGYCTATLSPRAGA